MGHGFEEHDFMIAVKERPWHGLGTIVESAPTIESAMRLAKLNWEVKKDDLFTSDNIQAPAQVTYRMIDNKKHILGVVPQTYNVLQNEEAFKFFQPFLDNELATLETAGSLFNGEKIWVLAKISGNNLEVKKGDEIENLFYYLILTMEKQQLE